MKMRRIGRFFSVGQSMLRSKDYVGKVIVSEEAIYMLLIAEMSQIMATAGPVGALGAVIDGAPTAGQARPACVPFSELPEPVRLDPVWGRVPDRQRVIVLPKASVTGLSCSHFVGLKIDSSAGAFHVQFGPLGAARTRQVLTEFGWQPA